MKHTLAIFGAGVATIPLIQKLNSSETDLDIVLVDPKDYVELPFSMLRSFMDKGLGNISRKKIQEMYNLSHIQSKLVTLDHNSALLENGKEITFDYAVIATGANSRGFSELTPNKEDTLDNRMAQWHKKGEAIKQANSIIIVGGGVIGVELACEILEQYPDKKLTILSRNDRLISHMDKRASKKALRIIKKLGKQVEVKFNEKIEYQEGMDSANIKKFTSSTGVHYKADLIFLTLGNEYHCQYMHKHFKAQVDEQNRIKVDAYLRVKGQEHIFAIGDISNGFPTTLGHVAMVQGGLMADNILNILDNKELQPFKSSGDMEFITLGRKHGIVKMPFGRLDFMIKVKQKDFFASKFLVDAPS